MFWYTAVYRNQLLGIKLDNIFMIRNNEIQCYCTNFRFGAFEFFRSHLVNEKGDLSTGGKLICGLGAGVCEAIIAVTPMETIKVKFINDQRSANPKFKGFAHGVGAIIKQEGIVGIYKGLGPTILKQGSNQAMRFYVMESFRELYKGDDKTKPVPKLVVGAFGVVAGAVSVFGNTPIDVIKTRMQGLESSKYKNSFDCCLKIWKNDVHWHSIRAHCLD